MGEIGVVYASNDPAHAEAFHSWSKEVSDWRGRCKDWARSHNGEALIFQPDAWTPFSFRFAGLKSKYRELVGPDWRVIKCGWYYARIPKRSTKAGKALAEDFDALKGSPTTELAGMPSHSMRGLAITSPAVSVMNGRLYVAWSELPKPLPDPELWTETPRSEYYRLIEEAEGAA